ncbi:MAG: hypothetical protein ACMUHM_05930 [Thermoplasmatota archaeon]
MEHKGVDIEGTDGLSDHTPLGSRIGRVKVAVRPPDPVLLEKLQTGIMELSERGVKVPEGSSMAVRSIDGFYYIPDLTGSLGTPDPEIVSIINYDPVRRTFILSGNGSVDDTTELFWFAFEAFGKDHVLFKGGIAGGVYRSPDDLDQRLEFNLGILRSWKESNTLRSDDRFLWRGPDLQALFEMIETEYANGDQSMSQ